MNRFNRASFRATAALLTASWLAPALGAAAQSSPVPGDDSPAQAPPAPAAPPAARSPGPAAASATSGVINLNTATLEELMRLPGVGPRRAQAILELRAKLNGFKRITELMRVKGIGRKTFRKLEPMLRLSGETTLTEAPRGR